MYEPTGIVRNAKAEAKASLILAGAEIEKRALIERAAHRIGYIETRRQQNVESVTEQAKQYLPQTVSAEPVSEDWMVNFFESCKDIGAPELQSFWARLLAGEVAKPKSFSRRTLELLKTFDPEDARGFTTFASLCFTQSNGQHFAFSSDLLNSQLPDLEHGNLELHLASLGLLNTEKTLIPGYLANNYQVYYFEEPIKIIVKGIFLSSPLLKDEGIWIRPLTKAGEELIRIVPRTKSTGLVKLLNVGFVMDEIELKYVEVSHKSS